MYQFSAKTNSFYPDELLQDYINNQSLPDDVIPVTESVFQTYTGQPPAGKARGYDVKGLPAWIDIPPPSLQQLREQAEAQKNQLAAEAEKIISPLSRAEKHGVATDAEKSALAAWEVYTVMLNRVSLDNAPDIVWPEKPE
ncbi:tail fiber assembly protein [Serratia liquefaciens]|uniref:tail fiber assembly protein n=1 Tax=Serratia liquefaciens TaxID=614 RepID=UPI003AF350F8